MKLFTVKTLLLCILCSGSFWAAAQNLKATQKKFAHYTWASPVHNHQDYFSAMAAEMQLSPQTSMQLLKKETGLSGVNHYRYQQTYAGLPVVANVYILHERHGKVHSANGLFTPQLNLSTVPTVTAQAAEQTARRHMLAQISRQAPAIAAYGLLELQAAPGLCIIDAAYPRSSGQMRLAYQLELSCDNPVRKMVYYIDAQSGQYIAAHSRIHEHGVPGSLVTRYYGTQTATVDSVQPNLFYLRDITRGDGIVVVNNRDLLFQADSKVFDLTNDARDEAALDAFYVAQKYFDFLGEHYGRNGLDNEGMAPKIRVHANDAGRINAYWDGSYGNFGDGDCSYGPLTSAEVVAHEFTHGLTEFTSGLIYASESGAINESISDMFGKAFEYLLDRDNFSWTLGPTIYLNANAEPIRVMDDPKSLEQPALYKGQFWQDNADVHLNSSVGNLWFVYLVDGRTGTNEAGTAFDVQGIGMLDALKIAYAANTHYNVPTTNYPQFAVNTLEAAKELYGENSAEALAVSEAWKAVGVTRSTEPKAEHDLGISFGSYSSRICDDGALHYIDVILTNYGSATFDGSVLAKINIYNENGQQGSIGTSATLQPGESRSFPVQIIKDNIFLTYNLSLEYPLDEVPENNDISEFFEVVEYSVNNLGIDMFLSSASNCKGETVRIPTYISNNGCDTIPAGTMLELVLNDATGTPLKTMPVTVQVPLFPGSGLFNFFDLPEGIPTTQLVVLELKYDKETLPLDNRIGKEFLVAPTRQAEFKETFETWPQNSSIVNFTNIFLSPATITYQNRVMLGFTGVRSDTSERQRCEGPALYFSEEDYLTNNGFNLCLDYSADNSPVTLSFDLALFRNYFNDNTPFAHSAMIKVSWEGTDEGSRVFYDQAEGAIVNHSITLPDGFAGILRFYIYTEVDSGDPQLSETDLARGDVVLLDNLQISTTSKVRHINSDDLTIYPNPVTEQLNVHFAQHIPLVAMQVKDINGKTLIYDNAPAGVVDVSTLAPGIYFLIATDSRQARHIARFIVSR